MRREDLQIARTLWRGDIAYGSLVAITYFPTLYLTCQLTSRTPAIRAVATEATVAQPDGSGDPYLVGETSLGEVSLTAAEVEAIPGAAEAWGLIIEALYAKLESQTPLPPEPAPENPGG